MKTGNGKFARNAEEPSLNLTGERSLREGRTWPRLPQQLNYISGEQKRAFVYCGSIGSGALVRGVIKMMFINGLAKSRLAPLGVDAYSVEVITCWVLLSMV